MTPIEEQLLLTLSHFEQMTLDKIFIDLDKNFVKDNPDLSMEDVLKSLKNLEKQKKVRCYKKKGHKQWIKLFPKRKTWWRKLIQSLLGR